MTSPYINTKLATSISLLPDKFDNKIYLNLKRALEKKVVGKCFHEYGYISDVFEILDFKDGVIEAENLMGSATFDVSFSCRLCRPIRDQQIVCQVNRVNKVLITLENGPIIVIITNDRINDEVFFTDNNNNLRYKTETGSHILKQKEFVKVTVVSTVFNHGDNKIKAIGFLDNVATETEVEKFYQDIYSKEGDIVTIDDDEERKEESGEIEGMVKEET
jgi:DNA-directed RNA polymerase subunit E'/Rpb7